MGNEGTSLNQNRYYAKFSDKEYYFRLEMYNNEGNIIYLKKNTVVSLVIDDNVFNPFHSGSIIISNEMYVMESTKAPYVFLGNGRDILDIEIIPITTGNFDADIANKDTNKYLGIRLQCVITDCMDVVNNGTKCKQLRFVEYTQYMLSESILNVFDLDKSGESPSDAQATNGGNSKTTTNIIKSILNCVYNEGKGTGDLIFKDDDGKEVFEGDADIKMNLNPYQTMSYAQALNMTMKYHSFKKSPCILNYDRFSKKFMLISLATLFKDNSKYLYETLIFPSIRGDEKTPMAITWKYSDVTFAESQINEFYIQSPTSKYNIELNGNSSILTTSGNAKSMLFDLDTLNSDEFTKTFYDLFCSPFESNFGNYGIVPNFYLTPNKKNNYTANISNRPQSLDKASFLNNKLQSLLYLNNIYQFNLNGMTHRQPMTFVDVVKYANAIGTDGNPIITAWDYSTLGRHMIVSVKHIFTQDRYINQLETIKPYRLINKQFESKTITDILNNFGQ